MIVSRQMVYFLVPFLFLFISTSTHAQNIPLRTAGGEQEQDGLSALRSQRQLNPQSSSIPGLIATEGAIDPETYVVGPGDGFSVVIGGPVPFQTIVPVSAEGRLLLPDAGGVVAAGKPLKDVLSEASALLRNQYQNVSLEISLIQPRRFYVHVLGAVPEPGRYLMFPLARLDDAVQQAFAAQAAARRDPNSDNELRIVGSATAERPNVQDGFSPSIRNISITRKDGSEHSYDLFTYYALGNLEQNPYLQDGDVVRLQYFDEDRSYVLVTGDVASPGSIEYREGDTVLDALRLVAGNVDLNTLNTIRLTRRTSSGIATPIDLSVKELIADDSPMKVQRGDHLNVEMQQAASAAIYGFVQFPGTYPIESAKTTLKDLLEMAGGLKQEANVRAAYLERRQSLAFKPRNNASDLDFFERAYFRESMRQNQVSIDIESALEADAEDIVLYSGDVVVFPRDENTVYVTGNVIKPGYIPFAPDRPASYYIQQAGGEAPLTTGIYVFEAGTGKVHEGAQITIRPGDTIFLNRESMTDNPELQALLITQEASKRQSKIATTQTIITGITALVSVVNTFLLIRDRL